MKHARARSFAVLHIVEELRQTLPPVFAGTAIGSLTGDAINWGTIQNKRATREIPDSCFIRSGTRVLVVRDPFLNWWATTLSNARQPSVRGRAGLMKGAQHDVPSRGRRPLPQKRGRRPAQAALDTEIIKGNSATSTSGPSAAPQAGSPSESGRGRCTAVREDPVTSPARRPAPAATLSALGYRPKG